MNEKKLDQILQQALTPEVNDNEIKVRFEKGEYPMKKKRNYIRPAVALVACAALVAGIGFGNLPEQILSNTGLSHKTDILLFVRNYFHNIVEGTAQNRTDFHKRIRSYILTSMHFVDGIVTQICQFSQIFFLHISVNQ